MSKKKALLSYILIGYVMTLTLTATAALARAECQDHGFNLEGAISIKNCDPKIDECISGKGALHEYSEKLKNSDDVLTLAVLSSPWRIYDADMRILYTDELAEIIKPHLLDNKVQYVQLYASWSDSKPMGRSQSISGELSELLGGFSVKGIDGFLWIKDNGEFYSTKQAFTIGSNFPYRVKSGDDFMQSLPHGAYIEAQNYFSETKDTVGLLSAAVGWDVYMLCPDHALQIFEQAAALSNSIAAYNAAVMRLDRGQKGDSEIATQLLTQAANAGDKKAKKLLSKIKSEK